MTGAAPGSPEPGTPVLVGRDLTLGYPETQVASGLDVAITEGKVTVIIGPNGSGKSTLLKALARLLVPTHGSVTLDGTDIHSMRTRDVARRIGLLPQAPTVSVPITVEELVRRGRYPHRRWFDPWSRADQAAVSDAMRLCGVAHLADRQVDHLSGGQRQRVWIALSLAQQAPVMLLDEPTAHLDLAHRAEVLDLLSRLNLEHHRTVVMVLHDLNEAARYAHHMIAVKDGSVRATGSPEEVLTEEVVAEVFGIASMIVADPFTGRPMCVPAPVAATLDPEAAR
jgi:iron complex transport system ATP-binding protein